MKVEELFDGIREAMFDKEAKNEPITKIRIRHDLWNKLKDHNNKSLYPCKPIEDCKKELFGVKVETFFENDNPWLNWSVE